MKHKSKNWYDSLNVSSSRKKPFLCVINRSFLTSQKKYENIKVSIDLVIHDECHTIENKSSQHFYNWLQEKHKNTRIIGFSATPEIITPLDKIISKYSIYDGFKDKVILPPRIMWVKSEKEVKLEHLMNLITVEINKLPYQKIIVWCGMIKECLQVAEDWKEYFSDFSICVDFNDIKKMRMSNYRDFNYFYQSPGKSILFCAVKHREGSDIPRVDGCIFMDRVEKRSERVFIQCMGRVLRKDPENKKKYGLVIDLKAKVPSKFVIDTVLSTLDNIFPEI